MSALTLTVDASARPLGLVPAERMISRIVADIARGYERFNVLVSDERRRYRSGSIDLPCPVIVMGPRYVPIPAAQAHRVSRRVLFARDQYRCQYCGFQASPGRAMRELTLDHVKPAHLFDSRAAATTWENVTTACRPCNQRKGGDLPWKAGMHPRTTPRVPGYVQLRFAGARLNDQQRDYLSDFYGDDDVV